MPRKTTKTEKPPERSELMKAMQKIGAIDVWSDVPKPTIVRTNITSLNRAMRVGGIPGGMMGLIHGPSQGGKTILLAEILRAIAATGGISLLGDAEKRSIDMDWFYAICGDSIHESIFRWPARGEACTYQSWICKVQEVRELFRQQKQKGNLPDGAMLGIGIDSIDRLAPEEEMDDLIKSKGKSIGPRGYPLRAMMHANWLKTFVPSLEDDEVPVFIVRESTNMNAGPYQKTWKLRGGRALEYDAGWIVRCDRSTYVSATLKGHKDKVRIGQRHDIVMEKNSVGPWIGQKAWFYTGIGRVPEMPLGLDRTRELVNELILRGLLDKSKSKKDGGTGTYLCCDEDTGVMSKDGLYGWISSPERIQHFSDVLDADAERWSGEHQRKIEAEGGAEAPDEVEDSE